MNVMAERPALPVVPVMVEVRGWLRRMGAVGAGVTEEAIAFRPTLTRWPEFDAVVYCGNGMYNPLIPRQPTP